MTHKIVVVYQSLLGIYGDRGNAMVLVKRLVWRGIDAELIMVEPGDPVPDDGLIYLLGGGEDWAQIAKKTGDCIVVWMLVACCLRSVPGISCAGTRSRLATTMRCSPGWGCWTWKPAAAISVPWVRS